MRNCHAPARGRKFEFALDRKPATGLTTCARAALTTDKPEAKDAHHLGERQITRRFNVR